MMLRRSTSLFVLIVILSLSGFSVVAEGSTGQCGWAALSALPFADEVDVENGIVTYEAFGAVGDGATDDLPAICKAHEYANAHGLRVRTKPGATYHLGGKALTVKIATSTDWNTSRFIIDDTKVENNKRSLFEVCSLLKREDLQIERLVRDQKKLKVRPKQDCHVVVTNRKKKRFIRRGLNRNSGVAQQDCFILHKDGSVEGPIDWNYDHISRVVARPIDEKPLVLKGGVFTTFANRMKQDVGYNYWVRNIRISRSNTEVVGLTHYVKGETSVGHPYSGFISVGNCADITLRNCFATAHKTYKTIGAAGRPVSMGSYDYSAHHVVNFKMIKCRMDRINDRTLWGVIGTNFCKNILLEDCTLSRMDAHMGVSGTYIIRRTTLGYMGLNAIGRGKLIVEDSTLHGRSLINFRSDYGSTWEGEVVIRKCRWIPDCGRSTWLSMIYVNNDGMHDFGYDCFMPREVTIDGLFLDDSGHGKRYQGIYFFSDPDGGRNRETVQRPFPYTVTKKLKVRSFKAASGKKPRISPNARIEKSVALIEETRTIPDNKRPNILFIMSDDHTAQAIGAYATVLKGLNPTPTIDSLAREGIVFENAFCTNSICTPSRACIITGQYPHTNRVFDLTQRIEPARQTLAIEMRKAGYQTAVIGKWHLKEEPNFDYYKVLPGQGSYFNTTFRIQGDLPWPKNTVTHKGEHSSDAITDSTIEWFKTRRDPNRPFFVCHQYKAPHDFFQNAQRYQSYLADVKIPEPPTLYEVPETWGSIATRGYNDELMPHIGTSIGSRNPRRSYAVDMFRRFPEEFPDGYNPRAMSEVETTRLAYQAYLKKYLRCVKGVDDNLKRLFDYLKKEGLYDNTVIIYTGDQGFWLGEKDFQDKRWAYDQSQRMPFIVRYPKAIPAGTRSDAIIENIDYPALMLDYAGAEIPGSFQGRSFRSICETGREPDGWKKAAYYRYWMHMAHHDNPGEMAIRTKTHKLIYFYGCDYKGGNQTPPGWELYDLAKDPHELNNVYDDPAYAEMRDALKARFARLRKEVGDDGSHFPECEKVVQEFWDYDEKDREKAVQISHQFKARRLERLSKRKR